MASPPIGLPQPPANENPIGPNGQYSQAWQLYNQQVSAYLSTTLSALQTGTTTNDDAAPGQIGEYIEMTATVALANGSAANVTSDPLTAGDWDVSANGLFTPAGGTHPTHVALGLSLTPVSFDPVYTDISAAFGIGAVISLGAGCTRRFSLPAAAPLYLVALSSFTGGSMSVTGFVGARRAR